MTWLNQMRAFGVQTPVKAGEVIYSESEKMNFYYVIISGSVGLYCGSVKVLESSVGSLLGVESFISEESSPISAMAEKESLLVKIPAGVVNTLLKSDSSFAEVAITSLQKVTRALCAAVSVSAGKSADSGAKEQAQSGTDAASAPPKPISAILPEGHKSYGTAAPPAWSDILINKEQTCPICQKKFDDQIPLSYKLRTKEVTHDMRTIYEGFELLWYSVRVCPHCNIAALTSSFPKINKRDSTFAERAGFYAYVPKFSGFSPNRTIDEVFEAYHLAVKFAEASTKDPRPSAQLWRRLMWRYGDVGDEDMRMTAARNTLDKYAETFQTKSLNGAEEQQLNIVLGDLYLLFEEKASAYKHFMNVIKMGKTGNLSLYAHAGDAIQDMRAAQEQN